LKADSKLKIMGPIHGRYTVADPEEGTGGMCSPPPVLSDNKNFTITIVTP